MRFLFSAVALVAALNGAQAFGQTTRHLTEGRLDLFIRALRPPLDGKVGDSAGMPQTRLEQLLRTVPPMSTGHGGDAPLAQGSRTASTADEDPSIYGFCYEACRTERAFRSCGTPAPGSSRPPQNSCRAIEDTPAMLSVIGPPLGAGASPFVDDNKSVDPAQQPAGYTILGQFIDHDVTRTQTALLGLGTLHRRAQKDAGIRAKLAAAGITLGQLKQAIADAASPSSTLSVNTGKLDLDSVYGVTSFAALTKITGPWFERRNGVYTGRFAQRHVKAPVTIGIAIDGFDYPRDATGEAEIPDPRNSENKIISQIQNLFELGHNDCMDHMLGSGIPTQQQIGDFFELCRKKVLWTYETIVATDFLPRFSAEATLARVSKGALHAYQRGTPATSKLPRAADVHTYLYSCKPGLGSDAEIGIPHEFAVAAFRLGHTLVRNEYVLHDEVHDADGNLLTGRKRPIFAAAGEPEAMGLIGDNLLAPADVIDWSYFYDTNGKTAQPGRPVDALVSEKLFNLPIAALPPGPDANGKDASTERNLPRRNLIRAAEPTSRLTGAVGLATGEEAEAYAQQRIPGLHDATSEVRNLLGDRLKDAGFKQNILANRTPLWLFILAEAESTQGSRRLGELGSHFVAEFLLGSLRCDWGSVLYANDDDFDGWGPTEMIKKYRRYSMPDLLSYLQDNAKLDGQPIRLFSR